MPLLDLSFASGEDSLSVRRFAVRERISSCFEVSVWARSSNEDIDLASIVGKAASFHVASGVATLRRDGRIWTGICADMEQEQAEATGLSSYRLRIVPPLWMLTKRRNHRVFQRVSVPEIVDKILAEWRIEPTWKIDRAQHPKLEMRVQYGESDYHFISRLLEEAGIAFYFHDDARASQLFFHERPQAAEPRAGGPIPHVDNPNQAAEREFVSRVRQTQEVHSDRYTYRDFDFRGRPEHPLLGEAAKAPDHWLEQYHYRPGSFLIEGGGGGDTPVADDKGAFRHDDKAGKSLAERSLDAARVASRAVSFTTNALDLAPGVVFSIGHHPRSELASDKKLLVTELSIEGSNDAEWSTSGRAVFAEQPYRPTMSTAKPQIHSVQSAIVVGPKGEEIHTDEFGRVRVQFHWDREGAFDEKSSCWMRVSQGWAGGGFGMLAIPRVGQEVLVGFLGGDPDQPVVVGRLYNNAARVPYKLPESKAVSGWKSDTSPGSGGFNELRFEDRKGSELVHVQGERNLTKLVKVDETETTGRDRVIHVGRKLTLTNGEASIILDGPRITIEAKGKIKVNSTEHDVVLTGSPRVMINPAPPRKKKKVAAAKVKRAKGQEQSDEPYSEGVGLRGGGEFRTAARAAMDRLGETRTGRAVLRKIGRSGQAVMIVETRDKNGACKAESLVAANRKADGSPGPGCGSTVMFNPAFKPEGAPSEVVLGHHLVRAWHNATGTREPGMTGGVKNAELKAVGLAPFDKGTGPTENKLRKELGVALRGMG